jgi:hypothetical protein
MTYAKKPTRIFIVVPLKNRKRIDVKKDCARIVEKYRKKIGNDNVYVTNSIYDQFMRYSMGVLSRFIIDMSSSDVVLLVRGCESDFMCDTLVDIAKHYLKKLILEEELDEEN